MAAGCMLAVPALRGPADPGLFAQAPADPLRAAQMAIAAGADGITAHLREDRRHIRDNDIARLMQALSKPLNFEMAATDEMVAIATASNPDDRYADASDFAVGQNFSTT